VRYTTFVNQDSKALEVETRPASVMRAATAATLVPGLTIVWHDDVSRIGDRAPLPGLLSGREERVSRLEPGFLPPVSTAAAPRPLADPYLSRTPVRLVPEAGGLSVRCAGTRTPVAAGGRLVADALAVGPGELERGVVLQLASRTVLLLHLLDPLPPPADLPGLGLVGAGAALVELRREIRRLAPLEVPVLLRGETGTGKELVARALHDAGPRHSGPYLTVNLAAVPAALAAAELFGAGRGAFTGADRARTGYFGLAAGGTLLLDEIGEAPAEIQPMLLRALESGEIQPIGATGPRQVNVRLLAATDADLEAAVAAGRFRSPLLHRLAAYEVRLPPLRQRRDDIGRLLLHFLALELSALGAGDRLHGDRPWLPAAIAARLAAGDWPGNVRQLRNVARQLAITCHAEPEARWGPQLDTLLAGSSAEARREPASGAEQQTATLPASSLGRPRRPRKLYRDRDEVGDQELLATLRAHRWRLQPAAASLGISRTALYERIEHSSSLRKAGDLSRAEIESVQAVCSGDLDAVAERLEVSRRGLVRRMRRLGL
jgi:two-component system, NtrC family, nitrogen regulation response regulator GlnG